MTNEQAPERIWDNNDWGAHPYRSTQPFPGGVEYLRADLARPPLPEDVEGLVANLYGLATALGPHDTLPRAAADTIEALSARIAELQGAFKQIQGIQTYELNTGNYDHDQVCEMDADWCEIGRIVDHALGEQSQ